MAHMLMVVMCLAAVFAAEGVEKSEQVVTCSQCRGKGFQSKWMTCPVCNGTAEIITEIQNGSMYDIRHSSLRKPTKANRQRCQSCIKSAKRGKVKEDVECPKCKGAGKVAILKTTKGGIK